MISMSILSFLFFLASLTSFIFQRKTVLSALLRLERIILSCLFQVTFIPDNSGPLVVFILIVAACERALGLTILVLISRTEETDKLFLLKT